MLLSQIILAPAEWIALGIGFTGGVFWLTKISYGIGAIRKGLELSLKSHDKRIESCETGVKENRESVIRLETLSNEA